MIKKIIKLKLIIISFIVASLFTFIFVVVAAVCGYKIGESYVEEQANQLRAKSNVINNQLYADRYRELLNKYLLTKGYVSLERLVFYLQRTNNVLDTSTLSYEKWDKAYLDNVNEEEKQMIPIKTICKDLKENTKIPTFTLENGENDNGLAIDVINLCSKDGVDITESNDYDEMYYPLPFAFPLKVGFTITSIVFEQRSVELSDSNVLTDSHSGWDIAVPIGTNLYSICDGVISNITNTQANDYPYSQSGNSTGNYMMVKCDNELTAMYWHLQYHSQPFNLKVGSQVKKGDLIGRTSTTGQSTGPHLHLGLKDKDGNLLDAMSYIDFTQYERT